VDAFSGLLAGLAGLTCSGRQREGCLRAARRRTRPRPHPLALLRVLPKRARSLSWSTLAEGRSLYGLNVTVIGAAGSPAS